MPLRQSVLGRRWSLAAGPHSPAALAGLGKVSARHLSRLFRSETGL